MDEKQKEKTLFIKIIVGGLALVILVLWIFNLKNVWRTDKELAAANDNKQWVNLKNDLDKTLTDVKKQLNQIDKSKKDQAAQEHLFSGPPPFLRRLEESLAKKIREEEALAKKNATSSVANATSSPISTSSPIASTSPIVQDKIKNCPAYINCMPMLDMERPCNIPVGCEGITTIAY